MPVCAAFMCNNRGTHVFPKDPKNRKLWEHAVRRKHWKPTTSSRLCSDHFKPSDFYGKSDYTDNEPAINFLRKGVVPSVFSHTYKINTPAADNRHQRYQNRCQRKLFTNEEAVVENVQEHEESVQCEVEIVATQENVLNESVPEFKDRSTQVNIPFTYGCVARFKDNHKAIRYYTGFESYKKFIFVYETLSPMARNIKYYRSSVVGLNKMDQFFLTMMKLRQNKNNFELALFFDISITTVSNIFVTWVNFMYQLWSKLNIWPEKDLITYFMPECFKKDYPTTRVILDGTEIPIQKPKNPLAQQASWSSYKHDNTVKLLVGATPGGLISYCSPAYAGSISDRQTVERSDLLNKISHGDSVMADRGFNIQDMFAQKDVTVNIPSFLKGKSQLSGLTLIKDRKLARKRVHIERLIGLTKTYKILKGDLDHNYVQLASKICFLCVMCCNFRECIMK